MTELFLKENELQEEPGIRSRRTGHAIQMCMMRFAPMDDSSCEWTEKRKILDAVYYIAAGQAWKLPTVEQLTELLAPSMGEEHLAERMTEMKDHLILYSDRASSDVSLTQKGADIMKTDLELRFVNSGTSCA